jgi:apolipoprotein N-acyltransferase
VFSLAAPPTNLYPVVLIGLGVLYLSSFTAPTPRRAAWRGFVWAASAGVVGMAFVPGVIQRFTPIGWVGGVVALVLLSCFQALAWTIGAFVARLASVRQLLPAPLSFGLGVLVAISLPMVFGWTPAGLVSPWPALIQLADLVGERGVSLILAVAAALFATPFLPLFGAEAPRPRPRLLEPLAAAALLALIAIYGAVRMAEVRKKTEKLPQLTVGVVQAAVPARLRWEPAARAEITSRLRRQTIAAERRGAELTIWPEAAYPYVLPHAEGPTPEGSEAIVGRGVHGPVLVGLITRADDGDDRYNAATIVGRDGTMQKPQAKLQLLWFGETVPLAGALPWLRKIFFRAGALVPGDEVRLLEHGAARIGVLNCYEDTLAGIGRRIALKGPNLLVNVTNDAWFGPTSEPELHLRLGVLRAVETRLDLVRAVNLGIPTWIDAAGSVRARGSDNAQTVMMATPALNDMSPTLYTRVGDIPIWLGFGLAALGGFARSRRRNRTVSVTEPSL